MNAPIVVQNLYLYPIKSLGGMAVQQAEVEERGFRYDRRWMLVDAQGDFVTQRVHPRLALLQVALEETTLLITGKQDSNLRLTIPLDQAVGKEMTVQIWGDRVLAREVGTEESRWFSDFLGMELHLVLLPESSQRKMDPRYAVRAESVSFADGMPYVIIGQSSLDDLNGKLKTAVSMDRFRPNLVFSSGAPFVEDTWQQLQIGAVEFQVVKPCARCVMVTVDQQTGEKGKEPLHTLASYRTVNNKVYFGQNAVALGKGIVRVGDLIQPLKPSR
jgi:uncharacterized protein